MTAPFKGSKLKIKRARRHIQEFEAEVRSYAALRPFALAVDQEPEFEQCHITVRHPPPEELPAIIGDAVHNLRAALDLLACDLVRLNGRTANGTYFPFPKAEADFELVAGDKLSKAPEDIRSMVKALRPWEGALKQIHALDVADKHRMILPALTCVTAGNFTLGMPLGTVEQSFGSSIPNFPTPEDVAAAEIALNASFKLVFPAADIGDLHSWPVEVAPTLHEFAQLIEGIVQTFEAHCFGDGA